MRNYPKGCKIYACIKDIKYLVLKRRGAPGSLPPITEQEKLEYASVKGFLGTRVNGVNLRKDFKLIYPIIKDFLKFIDENCPLYKKRLHTMDEVKEKLINLKKSFNEEF